VLWREGRREERTKTDEDGDQVDRDGPFLDPVSPPTPSFLHHVDEQCRHWYCQPAQPGTSPLPPASPARVGPDGASSLE
jgi:hypothetical protein